MSTTPRTDAEERDVYNGDGIVSSSFARQLETENRNQAKRIEELEAEVAELIAYSDLNVVSNLKKEPL